MPLFVTVVAYSNWYFFKLKTQKLRFFFMLATIGSSDGWVTDGIFFFWTWHGAVDKFN